MTDKAPKYPEDFGDGVEYEYHMGKTEKILLCAIAGAAILGLYYYIQIQNEMKTTDWTLDPNVDWTCSKLIMYEKAANASQSESGIKFPLEFYKNVHDKQVELNCK